MSKAKGKDMDPADEQQQQQRRVLVMRAEQPIPPPLPAAAAAAEAPGPPAVDPCFKLVDERRFFLVGEVLRNQASSGLIVSFCSLAAILCILPFMDHETPTRIGLSAGLCLMTLIFGLVTWTGSLRMKNLLEACDEIDVGPEQLAAALQNAALNVRNEGKAAETKKAK